MSYATLSSNSSGFVHGQIEFLVPHPGRPFCYGYEAGPDATPPTTAFVARHVRIDDVRTNGALSLDANGAALLQAPSAVRNFYDDDELHGRYYPEAADIIKSALGASRVVVYDHNVRRGTRLLLRADRYDQGRPVHHAHADYTEISAARRLRDEFGAEAQRLMQGRYAQVNLWRPIRGPLRDAPLAICDGASLGPGDLKPADLRYPDRNGEIYYLAHDVGQRWYYAPDMDANEVWLFKNFDSAPAGGAWVAPHSAFDDPRPHPHVPPRESIEVRAFALFDG